jgi:hypothetical protein
MAVPNVEQIVKSNAVVWVAPVGETLPLSTLAAGADWGGNFERVGFTNAPLACNYTSESFPINVEEHLGAIRRYKTSHEASFETVLAEFSLDYLQYPTQGVVTDNTTYFDMVVGDVAKVEERLWGFEGIRYLNDDSPKAVRLFFTRANAVLNGPLTFSKRDQSQVGISLKIDALADPDNSGALYSWHWIV